MGRIPFIWFLINRAPAIRYPVAGWAVCVLLLVALQSPLHARSDQQAFWYQGRIVVSVRPQTNEGYIQMAARLMERPEDYQEIIAFNGNRPVMKGRGVRFPLNALKPRIRGDILRGMHPEDELTERGWTHNVTDPLETLIQLTLAYTGTRSRFKQLANFNGIKNPNRLKLGMEISIPLAWIPDELGFKPSVVKAPLKLLLDKASGRSFVTYRLKPNETLYSVILRFTDRERASEVRRMAGLMVKLNGLRNERAVPAGRPLKMPLEWISHDFLGLKKTASSGKQPLPTSRKPRSGGLHVIIDPGHGGRDPGAVYGKRNSRDHVYEHEVVFDIALRMRNILKAAKVQTYMTIEDKRQTSPVAKVSTKLLGGETVRVTPPYLMIDSDIAVNLRVFMVDTIFRKLTRRHKVPPENIFLISIHGDALAASLRGAMVYFPDHRLRSEHFRPKGRAYWIRKEALPAALTFSRKNFLNHQNLSRDFGEEMIKRLKHRGIGVGGRRPVRPYYYRNGERTLPAILRFNQVPTSVLVEVGNLNNFFDRQEIMKGSTRQQIAQGIADTVLAQKKRNGAVNLARKDK